jgi:hypothetical protein
LCYFEPSLTCPQRKLGVDKSLDELDLEVDVTPFIDPQVADKNGKLDDVVINTQGTAFVGKRVEAMSWNREAADKEPHVDLDVMCE